MIEFPGAMNPARPDAPAPGMARAYRAVPPHGTGPGILVAHAWWGLNGTFRGVCDRLAGAGYVAIAPDFYGDGGFAMTIDEAEARSSGLDLPRAEQTLLGAVDRLRSDPSLTGEWIGTMGFSMGAGFALWLSQKRPDEVGAVVMVYGTGGGDYAASRAPVQLHYTPQDAYESLEDVEATKAGVQGAGRGLEAFEYPGLDHWFFEPDRPEYDVAAAELAWDRILTFLTRELKPGS
jgi:carboxymethylenebutenolidase